MSAFISDIKYGLRQITKNPGFTIVAALTLAIGIGANITMFSVVNAVLLQPLPFEDADRLVVVQQRSKERGFIYWFSYPDFLDWKAQNQVFEDFAAYTSANFDWTSEQGVSKIDAAIVSENFFSQLKTSAHLGRTFTPTEQRQNEQSSAILSYDFWQRRFARDQTILGRPITLDEKVYTVIGILPQGFHYPESIRDAQVWTLLNPTGDRRTNRSLCWLNALGRLKPGISIIQATDLQNQWMTANGDTDAEILMFGLHDMVVRGVRTTLWILSVIVGFILLIVCANVANLCLARASTRDKEVAVRRALGANRWRLLRQFTTESMLLSLIGGIMGLMITVWMISIVKVKIADFVPMSETIGVEPRELLFALGLSILVGLILGLMPFYLLARPTLVHTLTERQSPSKHRARVSNAIIALQIAVALILSTGMVLMVRSMMQLSSADCGFAADNLVTFNIGVRGMDEPQRYQLTMDMLERLRSLPYVKGASTDSSMPSSPRSSSAPVTTEGYQAPDGKRIRATFHNISPDYFETMQIPFRQGRDMTSTEHLTKASVVVINESLAHLFWANEYPIGRELDFCGQRYQVIGVVADMIQGNIKGHKPNHLFFPYDKAWPKQEIKVVIRTEMGLGPVVRQARALLKNIDATVPLYGISSFKTQMNKCISQERFTTTFLTIFASIALLLIVIGIYAVVSYAVAQRTREIGIRMALGAQQTSILVMVFRQGLVLLTFGLVAGTVGAVVLTRFLSSYLYEISTTDPVTFIVVPLSIATISLLACLIPACRAARVDPMEALRYG